MSTPFEAWQREPSVTGLSQRMQMQHLLQKHLLRAMTAFS
jgi:hypothetical protein